MQWSNSSHQNFVANIVELNLFGVDISKFSGNETLDVVNASSLQAVANIFFFNSYSCIFNLDFCVIVLYSSAMCRYVRYVCTSVFLWVNHGTALEFGFQDAFACVVSMKFYKYAKYL